MPRKRGKRSLVRIRRNIRSRRGARGHPPRSRKAAPPHPQTAIERLVAGWLAAAGLRFESEYAISQLHVDFYLPDTHTAIEVNGCFWHKHAVCYPRNTKVNARRRERDRRRYAFLRNAGYRLLVFWQCDLERDPEGQQRYLLSHV